MTGLVTLAAVGVAVLLTVAVLAATILPVLARAIIFGG